MQVLDFFGLERSLQDRFVEAASGSVAPTPLAFKAARPGTGVLLWWGVCLLVTVSVIALLGVGLGSLDSSFALLGVFWAVVASALVALAVFAALRALSLDHMRDSLPYRAGSYVFPIGVVDAQTEVVRIYRFSELSDVSRSDKRVTLVFENARFDFETADAELSERLLQTVEQNRQRVSGVSGPPSSRELAALDPLANTGFKSPFTPTEPLRKSTPRWLRFGWLEAIVAGALLGPLLWKARNWISEERLYVNARNLGTTGALRQYLAHGGARPDVAADLLPRAELREAIAKRSVRALEDFLANGKQPPSVEAEARTALKQALLVELSDVAAKGSVTELANFERAQPHRELIQKEIDLKRAELYQKVARAFAAVAQPATPGLVGVFGRLLFYAQKHGPEVKIAFRRRSSDSTTVEAALTKSAYFMGPDELPSRYFRPEDWEPRERKFGQEIEERLNREFPPDVLHFKLAPALADDGSDNPKLAEPTLLITHGSQMSGAFMSKKPRGAFVGLGFTVRSALIIPGDDQPPLSMKYSAWLRPDLKKWEEPGVAPKDIYELMANDGLGRYTKKQLAFLFKAP
jgi:hypothetical protein